MSMPESRPADWRQREQALDPERSCIVQAPAGSGKTELLIQRMLRLLAAVEQPEEVVAITFTRKAAAEMANRLVRELQAADHEPEATGLEPHKQRSRALAAQVLRADADRQWDLLLQPSRLQIRTIDSLCSELARRLPVLSGLGGGHLVAGFPEALYQQAASRTLAAIEKDDDPLAEHVVRVLDRYDNQYDSVLALMAGMLASRDQWLGHVLALRSGDGFDRAGLEAALRLLVESQLEYALAATPNELTQRLDELLRFALEHTPADEEDLRSLLERFPESALDLGASAGDLSGWQTLIRRLLTADGKSWRKTVTKKDGFPAPSSARGAEAAQFGEMKGQFVALLGELHGNEELRALYDAVRLLPEPAYEDAAWDSLESLLHLLLRAAGEWGLVATEAGEVDFTEVSRRAIQSLGQGDAPSELALRMDYRISHLLVDEFQDTSSSQILLLRRLTAGWTRDDGRSLFLVGDPMQSVYRFRKAEVSLFIRAWEGEMFDQLELQALQLSVNFRSAAPVVDWVNATFPEVMPAHNDSLLSAVRYSPSTARPAADSEGGAALSLRLGRDAAREAREVIEIIAGAPGGETIAVLVRSRNHASEILATLDRLKEAQPRFRYQAIDFFRLADTPLVQDLVSLTLALVQPADSLAWLSVLRAPFAGFGLSDLERLARFDDAGLMVDALRTARPGAARRNTLELSADGRARLARVAPPLLQAMDQRGLQPIRRLVETAWLRLGGPACLSSAGALADAQTYFELIESLEAQGHTIDRDSLDLRLTQLFARPDPDADGRLKIMTIYAAKGLEFDRVIVPGLDRAPRSDRSKLVHWFELPGADQIALSPMRNADERGRASKSGDLIQFIAGTERRRQALEDGRLLYVAATRSIRQLHLLGAVQPRASGALTPAAGSLLGILWPAVGEAQITALLTEVREAESNKQDISLTPLPQVQWRLPADWSLPPAPEPVLGPEPAPAEARDEVEFSWVGEGARLAGVLVHRVLQQVGQRGIEPWQRDGGMTRCLPWCRNYLAARGLRPEAAAEIVAQVEQAVARCLASEHGRWALGDHSEAACELAITAMQDGRPRSLVLDRTFVEAGVRWIIDYKTSRHAGGDLEGFLRSETERYTPQLRRYRAALAGELPVRTALYYPLLDCLCEVE